jgi:DNA-binding response OmpR family regulator
MAADPVNVLVVEDEEGLAELYQEWLSDDYHVSVAYTASDALDLVDETVDVVLLDRRLPDGSGSGVLEEIRSSGLDCRVAMVTAVDPDFDIIRMGFDAYLTKPVSQDDLHEVVTTLESRRNYDDQLDTYLSLVEKRTALEQSKPEAELETNPEYQELTAEIEAHSEDIDDMLESFDEDDFRAAFLTLGGGESEAPAFGG